MGMETNRGGLSNFGGSSCMDVLCGGTTSSYRDAIRGQLSSLSAVLRENNLLFWVAGP